MGRGKRLDCCGYTILGDFSGRERALLGEVGKRGGGEFVKERKKTKKSV